MFVRGNLVIERQVIGRLELGIRMLGPMTKLRIKQTLSSSNNAENCILHLASTVCSLTTQLGTRQCSHHLM